ncbi:hypothetical protein BJP48_30930 [Paenibacillus odorifer]|nr:hypothetical protein BJP48_30930 [Paenibacillus odorifer]
MDFSMNFNQSVKVKLTDFGEQILRNRHEEWNLHYLERGAKDIGPYVSKADSEGYTSFQIWELIQKFGPYMSLAKPESFKGEMIFLKGEPEREEYSKYQVGDRVLTEAIVTEVDEDIGDVKIKVGLTEMWLRESQVVRK